MRFLYIILVFLISVSVHAQNVNDSLVRVDQKNIIYAGIGWGGLAANVSLSYERQILSYDNAMLNLRVAYGGFAEWGDAGHLAMINWAYLFGRKKSYLECDLGLLTRITDINVSYSTYSKKLFANYDFFPLINIGYRYYNPKKHFMFRTGIGTEYLYVGVGLSF